MRQDAIDSAPGQLPRRVLQYIRSKLLIARGDTVVVGVSGGPDSVCLLHILCHLREKLGMKLHVAHLNHLLRREESDADAEYVADLARGLKTEVTIDRRDVRAYQQEHRLSLEEAARDVRYAFFSEVARATGAEKVAVGHTADDQIETVLMHLIRGAGLAGLAGMPPLAVRSRSGLAIIRPLLEVRRRETEAYCSANGLATRTDSTNLLPDLLRNRVRQDLIPLLRAYNPNVEEMVLRLAGSAAVAVDYLDREVAQLRGAVVQERKGEAVISKPEFLRLHPALQSHVVRSAFEHVLGDLKDIEQVHIDSVVRAMAGPSGKTLSLPRGVAFYGDYDQGVLTVLPAPSPTALEGEHRLNVPGVTGLPGWRVKATIQDSPSAECQEGGLKACLDFDAAGTELWVRGRRRGDVFQPLGMDTPKKLQDFMVDSKIPRRQRDLVPIVYSLKHIVWVVGHRIDHRARVTDSARQVLLLEFEPSDSLGK